MARRDIPFDIFTLPEPASSKAKDYLESYKGWVYSAVSTISKRAAEVEIKLYKRKRNGDVDEIEDHDSLALLHSVNTFQTGSQFREFSYIYQLLTGEYVWVLLGSKNAYNEMLLLRPDWVEVVPDGKGGISKYIYRPGGSYKSVDIEPERILFKREFNPTNAYRGYSPVRAAAVDIDIDDYSDKWNRNYFFNSAMPSFILSTDAKMSPPAKKRFIQKWYQSHQGTGNSHKVAFMDGGQMKVDQLSNTMQELDFQASKDRIRDKILSAFHISKSNLGVTDDVNRANAEAQDQRFVKLVISPLVSSMVDFLNEFYLPKWAGTEDMYFDFESIVAEDQELKLKQLEAASKEGWLSINEIREEIGYDPIEGGDVIFKPLNVQPILGEDADLQKPEPEVPTETEPLPQGAPENLDELAEVPQKSIWSRVKGMFSKTKRVEPHISVLRAPSGSKRKKYAKGMPVPSLARLRAERARGAVESELKKLMVSMMKNGLPVEKKEPVTEDKQVREKIWKEFVAKTDIEEAGLSNVIRELAQVQFREMIDKIGQYREMIKKGKFTAGSVVFSLNKENKRWYKSIRPYISRVLRAHGDDSLALLETKGAKSMKTKELDMGVSTVDGFLKRLGTEFIPEINETTRQALISEIEAGIKAGEDVDGIIARINAVYDDLVGYRADRIARTEVLRAANWGNFFAYLQSGVVAGKQWLATPFGDFRPSHLASDGQTVALDEPFNIGGVSMMCPHDPDAGPEDTINCRCTTIPVLDTEFKAHKEAIEKQKTEKKEKLEKAVDDVYTRHVVEAVKKQELDEIRKAEEKLAKLNDLKVQTIDSIRKDTVEVLQSEEAKRDVAVKNREAEEKALSKYHAQKTGENLSRLKALQDDENKKLANLQEQKETKEAEVKTLSDRLEVVKYDIKQAAVKAKDGIYKQREKIIGGLVKLRDKVVKTIKQK